MTRITRRFFVTRRELCVNYYERAFWAGPQSTKLTHFARRDKHAGKAVELWAKQRDLLMTCRYCGTRNGDGEHRCARCGRKPEDTLTEFAAPFVHGALATQLQPRVQALDA